MTTLVADIARRSYTVDVPLELFAALEKVEDELPFMETLHDRVGRLPGVGVDEYSGHFGPCIFISVNAEDGDVDAVVQAIEDHLELCVAVQALLPDYKAERLKAMRSDPDTDYDAADTQIQNVHPLFAGPGFLFCDRGDLGVALHFRYDGEPCTKWFTDAAAQQWRDLVSGLPVKRAGREFKEALIRKVHALLPEDFHAEP